MTLKAVNRLNSNSVENEADDIRDEMIEDLEEVEMNQEQNLNVFKKETNQRSNDQMLPNSSDFARKRNNSKSSQLDGN